MPIFSLRYCSSSGCLFSRIASHEILAYPVSIQRPEIELITLKPFVLGNGHTEIIQDLICVNEYDMLCSGIHIHLSYVYISYMYTRIQTLTHTHLASIDGVICLWDTVTRCIEGYRKGHHGGVRYVCVFVCLCMYACMYVYILIIITKFINIL